MESLTVGIVVLALLTALNYAVQRSVLYPPFLFCLMWLLDLCTYRIGFIVIDPLHDNTIALILGGATVFTLGGLLSLLIPDRMPRLRLTTITLPRRSRAPKFLLAIFLTATVPFVIQDRIQKAAQGTGASFLQRAKNADVEAAQQSGRFSGSYLLNLVPPVATIIVPIFLLEEHDAVFWWTMLVSVFLTLAGGGRGGILTLIVSVTGIQLLQQHRERFLAAVRGAAVAIILFAVIFLSVVLAVKDTSAYSSLGDLLGFFLVGYIITPVAALDRVVQLPSDFAISNHTFQFLLKPLAALHLTNYIAPPVLDEFIAVPLPTNVYTVYRFFLVDFGVIGCLSCIFVIGFLHAWLYQRARLLGRLPLVLFGLSLFPVVMVIFDDEYFLVPFYLRAVAICLLYWGASSIPWRIFRFDLRWAPSRPRIHLRLLPSNLRLRFSSGLRVNLLSSKRPNADPS